RGPAPFPRSPDRRTDRPDRRLQYEHARAQGAADRSADAGLTAASPVPTAPLRKPAVLVVEDDVFLRLIGVILDPASSAERRAAFADFFAHDEPDFEGYCARVRTRAAALDPADVRLIDTTAALRANLAEADAL